nr:AAC(3) family N-acetyltransferase [uncultured Halomonas sp.]
MDAIVTQEALLQGLAALEVPPARPLMVHASLSRLGYVVGGAETVVRALLDRIGPKGTLLSPTQTWLNLDPSRGVHGVPEKYWPTLRAEWPGYDKDVTPSVGMGALAETIRTWPGASRSDHPSRSWSAIGADAVALTDRHDLSDVHGEASPLGAVYRRGGGILMMGVDYDKCTALHLAETRAAYPNKTYLDEKSWINTPHGRERVSYRTLDFDDSDFLRIGQAYEADVDAKTISVGNATLRYLDMRAFVDFAMAWMSEHRSR